MSNEAGIPITSRTTNPGQNLSREKGLFGKMLERRRLRRDLRGKAESLVTEMSEESKELVFAADFDGTVTVHGKIPREIKRGVRKASRKGLKTTIITGRPFQLFPDDAKRKLLKPKDIPLVSGGGATLTRTENNVELTVRSRSLREEDYENILPLVNEPETGFILYPPCSMDEKLVLWVPRDPTNPDVVTRLEGYKSRPNVVTSKTTPEELLEKLRVDRPSMIAVIANDPKRFEKKIPSTINWALNTGRIFTLTHHGIDKNSGVKLISDVLDVPLENFIVAGNDDNDYPMLLNEQVHRSIYVGDSTELQKTHPNPEKIIEVQTPQELGILIEEIGRSHKKRLRRNVR